MNIDDASLELELRAIIRGEMTPIGRSTRSTAPIIFGLPIGVVIPPQRDHGRMLMIFSRQRRNATISK